MRILVFCPSYVPAFRSGGAVRAVAGLASALGREFDLFVFAGDRDPGDARPLLGIHRGAWTSHADAKVYYAGPQDLLPHRVAAAVSAVRPDAYYVNSFFSPAFSTLPIALRWVGGVPRRPMLIAPRGNLHPAALQVRGAKKRAFLELSRRAPMYRDLWWQAGTTEEEAHVRRWFPGAHVTVLPDVTECRRLPALARPRKVAGELSVVFLSRITPVKNLDLGLRILRRLRGKVSLTVYGPWYEQRYYQHCLSEAQSMPENVRVQFKPAVPHERVLDTLAAHHVFLLPTSGESFGHAIVEAMLSGCVVVISDRTRWRGMAAAGVGWDLPLNDERGFAEALQTCVDMDDEEFARRWARVRAFASEVVEDSGVIDGYRALFRQLCSS